MESLDGTSTPAHRYSSPLAGERHSRTVWVSGAGELGAHPEPAASSRLPRPELEPPSGLWSAACPPSSAAPSSPSPSASSSPCAPAPDAPDRGPVGG